MIIDNFDTDKKVFIIAEIGNNHEGSYSLAEEMIGLAKEAGADAVKFQTFKTEHYISKSNRERFDRLKKFELSYNDFERLFNYAKKSNITFLSTPFDIESVLFLRDKVPVYKIASGDNNFFPLLSAVAETGKPILLSTGLADFNLIKISKNFIENIWGKFNIFSEICILHCITSYPVRMEEANLKSIEFLKNNFKNTIGYSDHTIGIDACVLATALGARIIEKHFTIDNNYSDFRDHKISMNPVDFKNLVQKIRETEIMLGKYEKVIQKSENMILETVRRSIAVNKQLKKGDIITRNALTWIRPGNGISPGDEDKVIGKKLTEDINAFDIITKNKIEN